MQKKRLDVELIKQFEGFRSTAYRCSANRKTIGFGTTKRYITINVEEKSKITRPQAEKQLIFHLEDKVYPIIEKEVKVELSENQYAAIASLIYNIGETNFRRSTLLRVLNEGNYKAASEQFLVWVKATVNGKKITLDGLVKRRKQEQELFDKQEPIEEKVNFFEYVLNYFKGV